ncbi:MAG: hypothetical protein U9R54_05335 [Bacteroidota bacterium]|nr:hypothetical protein [Bacteroidota bacterium]
MTKNILYLIILFSILVSCHDDGERFSFELPFYVSPINANFQINDTIWIKSEYTDKETNYYSGDLAFINSSYFETEIRIFKLGNFNNDINCINNTNKFYYFTDIGQIHTLEDTILNIGFEHSQNQYKFKIGIIAKEQGSFAILLKDKMEIIKIFGNDNFNRQHLNNYDIYELYNGSESIPIDERVYFIKID